MICPVLIEFLFSFRVAFFEDEFSHLEKWETIDTILVSFPTWRSLIDHISADVFSQLQILNSFSFMIYVLYKRVDRHLDAMLSQVVMWTLRAIVKLRYADFLLL